jgi:hypothetical protein
METNPYILGAMQISEDLATENFSERDQEAIVSFCEQIEAYRDQHGDPEDDLAVQAEELYAFDSVPKDTHPVIRRWMVLSLKILQSGGDGDSMPIDPSFLGTY